MIKKEMFNYAETRIQTEEVLSGRFGIKLLGCLPQLQDKRDRTVALYGYVRALEDRVDTGINPQDALALTTHELENVKNLQRGEDVHISNDFPQSELIPIALHGLPGHKVESLLSSMRDVVTGISWDSESIVEGRPLPTDRQRLRHLYASMPGFEMINTMYFDREFVGKGNPRVEKLLRTWIMYDALVDLDPDLSAGLVLFKQEDLDAHNIELQKGEEVPTAFENLFHNLKPGVARSLVENAKYIRETNLPTPVSCMFWAYFLSRTIKLAKTDYPDKKIVFAGNSE